MVQRNVMPGNSIGGMPGAVRDETPRLREIPPVAHQKYERRLESEGYHL